MRRAASRWAALRVARATLGHAARRAGLASLVLGGSALGLVALIAEPLVATPRIATPPGVTSRSASAAPARRNEGDAKPLAPVRLDSGPITGRAPVDGVRAYLGIPFAAPPIGPLRWRPPQPVASWTEVRECASWGGSCPQPPSPLPVPSEQTEDCLYLNVWTSATPGTTPAAKQPVPAAKQPVMVWIHGGGFFLGSGSGAMYDGAKLARKGVVVVTIHYRLGPFGFLGHPLLSKESEHGSSGNYGLLDQIAALQWVQRNAAAFGGDPGNVTIFGESAGAYSVGSLLVAPLAKGLFHRAIAQSGAAVWTLRRLRGPGGFDEPIEATGERVLRELVGDAEDPIATARAKSAEELLAAARPSLGLMGEEGINVLGPCADGWVLPEPPGRLLEACTFNEVPLLIGTNRDEGTLFVPGGPVSESAETAFRKGLARLQGELADRVAGFYSSERFGDRRRAMAELFGDLVFVAPTRAQVRALTRCDVPCFVYEFTRVAGRGPIAAAMGAFHGSEIPYVFGNLELGILSRYAPADRELSATMMDYWVQFARTGDPNREGLASWPVWTEENQEHLELGDRIAVGSHLHREACDLWDEVMGAVAAAR